MTLPQPLISTEGWTRWWNRISQIAGLGIIVYESVFAERAQFIVLLFAAAMMLGGAGLRILVRGAASLVEETKTEDEHDHQ